MTDSETAKLIKQMQKRLDQLEQDNKKRREENTKLQKRIEVLEKKLRVYEGPNSPSSQKPIYRKKKRKKSKSTSSGEKKKTQRKKKGREKGHEGSTLVLESDNEIHDYVNECGNCQHEVGLEDQKQIYSYQLVDLPEKISLTVTTHHVYETKCSSCETVTATEKDTLRGTIFGPKLAAFNSLLFYKGRVPQQGISDIIAALTDYEFSPSTIGNGLMTVADQLEEPVDEVKEEVRNSDRPHIDETGYISNITERKVGWIWSFSTPKAVFYEFGDSRSGDELEQIWGQDPGGTVPIVDGWSAYNFFQFKQRCWAHLLRECHDLATRRGGVAVAADERLSTLFHTIKQFKQLHPSTRDPIVWHDALIELEEIVDLLSMSHDEDIGRFKTKLSNAKHDLVRALQRPELPLTNNLAERCLRPLVIHRKIRGFVASERGKQTLTRHATMFETWNLRGDNPYDELLSILTAGG